MALEALIEARARSTAARHRSRAHASATLWAMRVLAIAALVGVGLANVVIGCSSERPATVDLGAPQVSDAAASDPSSVCRAYCDCLRAACRRILAYPYGDDGGAAACEARCHALGGRELQCWRRFCEQARSGLGDVPHACEHAWGAHVLEECP
jgi:hypothetical protein